MEHHRGPGPVTEEQQRKRENQSNIRSEGQNIFSLAPNLFVVNISSLWGLHPRTGWLQSVMILTSIWPIMIPANSAWYYCHTLTLNKPKVFINGILSTSMMMMTVCTRLHWLRVDYFTSVRVSSFLCWTLSLSLCKSQVFPNTERTRSFVIKIWFGTEIINKYDFYTEDNDFFHTINVKISKENDHKLNVYII